MKRHHVTLVAGLISLTIAGITPAQAQTASKSLAPTSGAMLYANGNVKVNGRPAGISTSIFAGDKVEVGDSSAVSISRSGSSVVLSPNSSVQYDPANLDVLQGTVRVSTSQGMSVHAGNVSVAPLDKSTAAKFDVTASAGNVSIASQEGALTVRDGGQTLALSSGSKTTLVAASPGRGSSEAATVATDNLLEQRLVQHPFYGVVAGVNSPPVTLPICKNVTECIRPGVSQISPCCCPPVVLCTQQ